MPTSDYPVSPYDYSILPSIGLQRQSESKLCLTQVNLEFKGIFECSSFAEAKKYFDLWLKSIKQMGIREVIKVGKRFQRDFDGVCNALCHSQSNATAERINGKIQEIKTSRRGYRTFEKFRSAILFFCGGLDLYPQDSW